MRASKWSYGHSCPVDFQLNIFIHSYRLAELSGPVTAADLDVPQLNNASQVRLDVRQLISRLRVQLVGVRQQRVVHHFFLWPETQLRFSVVHSSNTPSGDWITITIMPWSRKLTMTNNG